MANMFILVSKNNQYGTPKTQAEMKKELEGYLYPESFANLSQSLNDIADGKGKPTQPYTYPNGTVNYPVLHASSGKLGANSSISLFWYEKDKDHYIIAMGEHTTSTTYKLTHHGQTEGDFKLGKTITLK